MRNNVSWLTVLGVAVLSFAAAALEVDIKTHVDGYSFRDGKVVLLRGGHENFVTTEVSLHNGWRLQPDGIIINKEGTRERFRDSQWLTLDGDYVVVDNAADDFDGYYFEDGRVYVYRDRQPVLLTVEFTFGDGSRISPDGSFFSHDGSRSRMNEGQRVSKTGKAVEGKHTAATRTPANAANKTPAAPANAAAPTHNTIPATPGDATHKAVEPAKTREPAEHEKAAVPAHEKTATPAPAHEKAPAPEHEKASEKKAEVK